MGFKQCNHCGKIWQEREEFLHDPHLYFAGFHPNFNELFRSYFSFYHHTAHCMSTLTVDVSEFADLVDYTPYGDSLQKTPECPQYCRNIADDSICFLPCVMAPIRKLIPLLRDVLSRARLQSVLHPDRQKVAC